MVFHGTAAGQEEPASALAAGAVTGVPAALLRLEGVAALATAVIAYHEIDASWTVFAVLFLVPDVSMLGYLAGRRVGAACYNAAHTYLAPGLLGLAGYLLNTPQCFALALIWIAHIGFDRVLGYGLKYTIAFGATHLGWRGRQLL